MINESNIRRGRHFKSHVHWVFVTKHRRRLFDARPIDVLRGIFDDVCSDARVTLMQMDGEDDHVYLPRRPRTDITTDLLSAPFFP